MLQASASETFLYDNFCLSFSHIFKFAYKLQGLGHQVAGKILPRTTGARPRLRPAKKKFFLLLCTLFDDRPALGRS